MAVIYDKVSWKILERAKVECNVTVQTLTKVNTVVRHLCFELTGLQILFLPWIASILIYIIVIYGILDSI